MEIFPNGYRIPIVDWSRGERRRASSSTGTGATVARHDVVDRVNARVMLSESVLVVGRADRLVVVSRSGLRSWPAMFVAIRPKNGMSEFGRDRRSAQVSSSGCQTSSASSRNRRHRVRMEAENAVARVDSTARSFIRRFGRDAGSGAAAGAGAAGRFHAAAARKDRVFSEHPQARCRRHSISSVACRSSWAQRKTRRRGLPVFFGCRSGEIRCRSSRDVVFRLLSGPVERATPVLSRGAGNGEGDGCLLCRRNGRECGVQCDTRKSHQPPEHFSPVHVAHRTVRRHSVETVYGNTGFYSVRLVHAPENLHQVISMPVLRRRQAGPLPQVWQISLDLPLPPRVVVTASTARRVGSSIRARVEAQTTSL